MIQSLLVAVASVMTVMAAPILLLSSPVEEADGALVLFVEDEKINEPVLDVKTGVSVETIGLEEYLVGVLWAEMPASFHEEALKAQAVAARTVAVRQLESGKHLECDLCTDPNCCQAWLDEESVKRKMGQAFDIYSQKICDAVKSTEGQVLTYDGSLIDAVYFSCSGGKTEAASSVWGNDIPYLQPVLSNGEEWAPKFETEVRISHEEFKEIMHTSCPEGEIEGEPVGWFGEVQYTSGGGVSKMEIGGKWLSGTQLRKMYHLNSTKFYISVEESDIVFYVFGYGHRVGMSQYGANAMAHSGKDYISILEYYYTGATVEKQ